MSRNLQDAPLGFVGPPRFEEPQDLEEVDWQPHELIMKIKDIVESNRTRREELCGFWYTYDIANDLAYGDSTEKDKAEALSV